MKKEEIKETIIDQTKGVLTEGEIDEIINNFDEDVLENLEIIITSDPNNFEEKTRNCKYEEDHELSKLVETEVLKGDYAPGFDEEASYTSSCLGLATTEYNEVSDFSINQVQVASAYEENIDEDGYEENSIKLYIYIPEEREYGEDVSFKNMVLRKREENLFNDVKKQCGERLTDEQVRDIVSKVNLESSPKPKIVICEEPYKFEKETRMLNDVFEHSWAGSTRSIANTTRLIGDYEPGMYKYYEYSNNGNLGPKEEEHEIADFSINQVQAAEVYKEEYDKYNGEDYEHNCNKLYIYIPEEKEYGENVSFKKMVLKNREEKLFNAIKENTGEKLTNEQIKAIISEFDLENPNVPNISDLEDPNIPNISVSSDPYEFEKATREKDFSFSHSWAGYMENIIETKCVIGDYKPGIKVDHSYSDNGAPEVTTKKYEENADFSINKVQVATVFKDNDNQYNGSQYRESSKEIQIYLPDEECLEKEFKGITSFSELRAQIMNKTEEASLQGIKEEMEAIKAIKNDKSLENKDPIQE